MHERYRIHIWPRDYCLTNEEKEGPLMRYWLCVWQKCAGMVFLVGMDYEILDEARATAEGILRTDTSFPYDTIFVLDSETGSVVESLNRAKVMVEGGKDAE